MHDILRTRVLRKLESLPEDQVYQVLDYIEFLEAKYATDPAGEGSGLQSFAEKLEDQLRRKTMSPASLREAFQLISAADKVLSNVSKVGKEILGDLNGAGEGGKPFSRETDSDADDQRGKGPRSSGRGPSSGTGGPKRGSAGEGEGGPGPKNGS